MPEGNPDREVRQKWQGSAEAIVPPPSRWEGPNMKQEQYLEQHGRRAKKAAFPGKGYYGASEVGEADRTGTEGRAVANARRANLQRRAVGEDLGKTKFTHSDEASREQRRSTGHGRDDGERTPPTPEGTLAGDQVGS